MARNAIATNAIVDATAPRNHAEASARRGPVRPVAPPTASTR